MEKIGKHLKLSMFLTISILNLSAKKELVEVLESPQYNVENNLQNSVMQPKQEAAQESEINNLAIFEKRLEELNTLETEKSEDETFFAEELHEVLRLNEICSRLQADYKLDWRDYLLKAQRTESGETLPSRFAIINSEEEFPAVSLEQIAPVIRQIGTKDMEIKRFKGLGEMNSDQLWETTMNPETRTLLKVRLEDAGEADRLFSILMGDDVEKRRNFIQEHALEVQNLDV